MIQLSRPCQRKLAIGLLATALLVPTGCSKADINQALDDAKTKTQSLTASAVEKVEQQLPATGSIRLDLTPVVEIDRAEIEVIMIGDGRPNVVQLANYDTAVGNRPETALLLSGTTTAANSAGLAGQSIECDMYFQQSASTPIAISKPGEAVTVVFDSINEQDKTITGTVKAADLMTSDGRTLRIGGATMVAVVLDQIQ